MSSQRQPKPEADLPDAEAVREYLRAHPEFFDQNRQILDALRLPHGSGGGTVSLVERQVASLRQKNLKLDRKLKELVSVARANDRLVQKIHLLTLDLMHACDLAATLNVVENHLRTNFAADLSVMVLFSELDGFASLEKMRFLKVVSRDDPQLQSFDTFLGASRPRCGQIRDAQRDFLFGTSTDEVGSAALVPLGEQASLGLIGIGSVNAEHFHPAMSIDFLIRIGELVSGALERWRTRRS